MAATLNTAKVIQLSLRAKKPTALQSMDILLTGDILGDWGRKQIAKLIQEARENVSIIEGKAER